jgi:hypothetical protein
VRNSNPTTRPPDFVIGRVYEFDNLVVATDKGATADVNIFKTKDGYASCNMTNERITATLPRPLSATTKKGAFELCAGYLFPSAEVLHSTMLFKGMLVSPGVSKVCLRTLDVKISVFFLRLFSLCRKLRVTNVPFSLSRS